MPAKIGLMHTTALPDRLKDGFKDGLSNGGWPEGTYTPYWPPETDGKYGRKEDGTPYKDLENLAASYEAVPVDLIVASGGLACPIAAWEVLSESGAVRIPVVTLIGRVPQQGEEGYDAISDTSIMRSVLTLNTPANNGQRRDALVAAFPGQVQAATVGLMVNTNSSMWEAEVDEWTTVHLQTIVLKYPDLAQKKQNNYAHFPQFFKEAKATHPNLSGIVLSSDPYFFRYRSRLITAAISKCDVKICFPLLDFKYSDSGSPHPKWDNSRHIDAHGADLLVAYTDLGSEAAAVLNTKFPATNVRQAG